MVSINRQHWRPLVVRHGPSRRDTYVARTVRNAARLGNLAQLEIELDLRDNLQRRSN